MTNQHPSNAPGAGAGSDPSGAAVAAPPRRKRRWKAYVLLCLVLMLLGGEIALRVFVDRNSKFNIMVGGVKEWDPDRRVRLRTNYRAGDIRTNSKGLLGPEFDARKAPGAFRIVVLGDSCSFHPAKRNYPRVLEEQLRASRPDRVIEVVNASCPGYDSGQARTWYEREIDDYDHDVLLIYLGWNDMGQYNPDGLVYKLHGTGYLEKPTLIQRLLLNCYLLRSVYVIQGYAQRRGPVSLEPLNAEESRTYGEFYPKHFEQNLLAVIKRARERGRRVFLLNYAGLVTETPTPDEQRRMHFPRGMGKRLHKYLALKRSYESALRAVADATHTPIIDIEALFSDPQSREVFSDSVHFNVRGAEIIATRLAAETVPLIQ